MMTATKTCPTGHVFTYHRPKNYGGQAFANVRCPKCGK